MNNYQNDRRKNNGSILDRASYDWIKPNSMRVNAYTYSVPDAEAITIESEVQADNVARTESATLSTEAKHSIFIRESRKKLGLTQKAFGELLGVTNMSVYHWEKGIREPSKTALLMIKKLLIDGDARNKE